jgi:competence protein ComEC
MPVIWITLFYFSGILAADQLSWCTSAWLLGGVICSLVTQGVIFLFQMSFGDQLRRNRALIFSLCTAFFLGGVRYQGDLPDFHDPACILNFVDKPGRVELSGIVMNFPDSRDQIINLRIQTENLLNTMDDSSARVHGLVLAKIPEEKNVSYGDRVKVIGYLKVPPAGEDFDYRDFLKRQNVYVYLPNAEIKRLAVDAGGNELIKRIYRLRTKSLENIYQLWPDPEASLLAGILLGVETGISDRVQKAFRETGTTHVIAISGFNITIIAGIFSRVFRRLLNPRKGALAAVVGIGLYTLLVGADAAVVRSAVMGVLSIIAQQLGRRQHGLNAAALASLIMALFNPQVPWDISFQLSLSATIGLILYADPLSNWFLYFSSRILPLEKAQTLVGPVSEFVLFTFAAQFTTLPVMLYHFKAFSLNTFLTNPVILPVQPPIMILGGLALILSVIFFPLGQATAPLVYPFVLFTIRMVERFSTLPIRPGQFGPIKLHWIVFFYVFLGILTFGNKMIVYFSQIITRTSIVSVLGLFVVIAWRAVFSAPNDYLQFTLLDVGTGTAAYIYTPAGHQILINGGPSPRKLSDRLGRRLHPFQREVDYWIITSPLEHDIDAVTTNILRFRPSQVLWFGTGGNCWESVNLRVVINENKIPITYGKTGHYLETIDGVKITAISRSKRGGTLLLEYGSFRMLLPFGLLNETRQEWEMGLDLGKMTVLLLADNGYLSTNPSLWVENLNPQLLLLSVGQADNSGLPDRGLLDNLGGYSLLRTDQHGDIHLITDGKKLWVQVDRLP